MNRILSCSLTLLLTSCSASHAIQFYNLGDLFGGDFYSEAAAISADGSTVVGYSRSLVLDGVTAFVNADQAFRWTLADGMVGLGDLPGGVISSRANGVSGDGSVIVGRGASFAGDQAFSWTDSGGMSGLGDLGGGAIFSEANDVSADGRVIVGASESTGGLEAFQYVSGSGAGMVGLGDLPGGTFRSIANAISDDGLVIVGRSDSSLTDPGPGLLFDEAFRDPIFSGSLTGLGTLGASPFLSDGNGSSATAVSADGSVIVGWTTFNVLFFTAFRWTEADGMQPILGGDDITLSAVPQDITADGSIVVGTYNDSSAYEIGLDTTGNPEAFIWSDALGALNLQEHLEDAYGLLLPDWTLESATGISDDGMVITGYGINPDGNREAWVVNLTAIPEPNALCLMFAGGVGGFSRRSRAYRRWQ
ncbi:MAG: PEP-CTERM sorting domain-containing protein [Planctomycetota bacterium]